MGREMIKRFDNWKAFTSLAFVLLIVGLLLQPNRQTLAQFAGQATYGGTSGGTANAQTITVPNLTQNIPGLVLSFLVGAGLTNTDQTTINVSSIGVTGIVRQTPTGIFLMSGGELQAGQIANIMFDGTYYELLNTAGQAPIGSTIELRSSTIPAGYVVEDGTCLAQAGKYAPLFGVIGTTYNANAPVGCSGSQFAVPYSNGTMFAAVDTQGAHTASRITNSGTGNNCAATAAGVLCGSQNHTQTTLEMPAHTHPYTPSTTTFITNAGSLAGSSGGIGNTGTLAVATGSTGTGNAMPILPPILTGYRAIKY
jgi:hypothetical protein